MQTLVHSKNNIFSKIMSSTERVDGLCKLLGIYWKIKLYTISDLDWNVWEDIS